MDIYSSHDLIGQILVKTGKIKEKDLNFALEKQKSIKGPLGQILSTEFSVSKRHVNESVKFQKIQKTSGITLIKDKVGQILKKLGIITQDQIDETLKYQKYSKELFGKILVNKNLIKNELLENIIEASRGKEEAVERLTTIKTGELFFDLNLLDKNIISKALEEQKSIYNKGKRLGEILVEKGTVCLEKLKYVLSVQKNLSTLTLVTIMSMPVLAGCSTPRVSNIATVQNYNESKLVRVLKAKENGSVNYYQDGTIAISNVPFFQQGKDNTCAQAVMASILNYWGKNVPYQKVVNETNGGNLPTDVQNITNYLKKNGLVAQDYRLATLNFVKDRIQKGQPVIILLDFGKLSTEHYVVATGYNEDNQELIVLDPIDGPNLRIPFADVENMWENRSLKKVGIFGNKYDHIAFDILGDFNEIN